MVIKLDMMKANDRVSWFFLLQALRRFGFSENWIVALWRLISNAWLSMIVNGLPRGFFKSIRGLRQVIHYLQLCLLLVLKFFPGP